MKTSLACLFALPAVAFTLAPAASAAAAEPESPAAVEGHPAEAGGHAEPGEAEPEGRLAVAEAERGITFGAAILAPEIDFDVARIDGATHSNLTLLAAYGLTDDLNVRATILPLQLAAPGPGSFRYGQPTEIMGPSVGLTYRFKKGHIEVGASFDVGIVTVPRASGVVFTPGVPVRFHVGKKIRIDTGAFVAISRLSDTDTSVTYPQLPTNGNSSTTTGGLNVPLSFLYDITEPLHVGASTAFLVGDVSQWSATTVIPVTLFTGYAIAGKDGPILDIDPFFSFPTLLTPGATPATHSDFAVGLALGGYLYL